MTGIVFLFMGQFAIFTYLRPFLEEVTRVSVTQLSLTLLALWGLIATPAPVAWGLWLSRAVPDNAEAGGGLMVAVIQLAITLGAGIGGMLFDAVGWWSPFAFGLLLLIGSAIAAWLAYRESNQAAHHQRKSQCRTA